MPNTSGELAHIPSPGAWSACDLNLPLAFGAIVLGGFLATLALAGWLAFRRRSVEPPKSLRRAMNGDARHDGHDGA